MTKKFIIPLIFLGSSLFLSINALALSNVTCAAVPPTVNTNAAYTVGFRTGGAGALVIGDTIVITFSALNNTTVPASIPMGQITVNTIPCTVNATGAGQVLTITNPVAIGINTNVTVAISTGASNIVNPSIASATYTIQVNTNKEAGPVASSNYPINKSATSVNITNVSATPSTIGNPSHYVITFDTAADGDLWGGAGHSQIIIVFPSNTNVPAGGIAGITMTGGGGACTATGSGGNTITLTPAGNVAGGQTGLTIDIPSSCSVNNPTTASPPPYQLTVVTSAQPVGNSPNYSTTISGIAVLVNNVAPFPTSAGSYAQYTINLTTDATNGYLVGGTSQIVITFPPDTAVFSGAIANVTVNGPTAFSAIGNAAARTITIVPSADVPAGTFNVFIPNAGTNIRNPSTANPAYTLSVHTSPQAALDGSANYAITASTTAVAINSVTPSPRTIGNPSQYTINLTTDTTVGALAAGTSSITITLPPDTTVFNGAIAGVTVNGPVATSATGVSGARTITIVPSVAIPAGTTFNVIIPTDGGNAIRNPSTVNTYTLQVHTSAQPTDDTSLGYAINTSGTLINVNLVTPGTNVISNLSGYTINITTDNTTGYLIGGVGGSQIVITFPSDTAVFNGAIANVTVNGPTAFSATGNLAARTITIVPAADITGGSTFNIVIPNAGTNIRNRTILGPTNLQVHTSPQPTDVNGSYTLIASANPLAVGAVTVAPNTIGNVGDYQFTFDTAVDGALVGGTSNVYITFPAGTVVPAMPLLAGILVNGSAVTAASGAGNVLTVRIAPGAGVAASTSGVPVHILTTANIRNTLTASTPTYTLSVYTDTQPNPGPSGTFTIGTSATTLSATTVTVVPNTIGNYGQYDLTITTSANGALVANISTISVTFPAGTLVPAAFAAGDIHIGTTMPGTAVVTASGSGQVVTFTTPIDLNPSTAYIIRFTTNANVRNPTTAQVGLHLIASTSCQPNPGTSTGTYNIVATTGTALTVGACTVTTYSTIGNVGQYDFSITTSSDGGLVSGLGTVAVTFPVGTRVPATFNAGDILIGTSMPGTAVTAASAVGQVVTFTVPLELTASTLYLIRFNPSADIRNPTSLAGNPYHLTVATSVQNNSGNSGNYNLTTSATALTIGAVTVTPNTVGNGAGYSFSFTNSADGALVGGVSQLVITFPATTTVPVSPAGIQVNSVPVTSAVGSGTTLTLTLGASPGGDISGSSPSVPVVIPASAGIINPTSTGNYTLSAYTTVQPNPGTSFPAYSIGASSNPVLGVTASQTLFPNSSPVTYNLTFNTSADGPLYANVSHIFITFPDNTLVAAISSASVNGTPAVTFSGNNGTHVVDITSPVSIAVNTPGNTLVLAGLQNPTYASAGNTVTVSTTAQPAGPSLPYSINLSPTQVTVGAITVTPGNVNVPAAYNFNITLAVPLRANASVINVSFPSITGITNGALANVFVNGTPAPATGSSAAAMISIFPTANVPTSSVPIIIPATALQYNPSTPGTNTLSVATSSQVAGSNTFTLAASSSHITSPTVTVNPSLAGQAGAYQIQFNLGPGGRLSQGNIITVLFPAGTVLPGSITGNITVNGISTTGTVYSNGLSLSVVVPAGVSIGPNQGVNLTFTVAANILNPGLGSNMLQVETDEEPTFVTSSSYWITSNSHISVPAVQVVPNIIFAAPQITIDFSLGAGSNLTAGADYISLIFPAGFNLPVAIPAASISINGLPVTSVQHSSGNGNAIDILSPVSIAVPDTNRTIHIVITTASGITNPTLPGTGYVISGYTSIEPTPIASNTFEITPSTGTQLTPPHVDLFPAYTRSAGRYKINFNLGSLGGLTAGVSTINVQFPANVVLPASIAAGLITVNGVATAAPATSAGQVLTITVPQTLPVSAAVELIVTSHSGVLNPADEGDYTLTLYTSSEPNPVTSNSFHIAKATWNDIIVYPNPITKHDSANKAFTFFLIPSNTATLRIYTLNGLLVKSISKNDDSDKIGWDLNNEQGSPVASGIYLYVLSGPGGSKKGKLAVKN